LLVKVGAGTYQRLLPEGVIIRPMGGYGFPDYARVSVGLPAENERFIAAMEKLVRKA
jgi:histidinol-phosphate aminotransferase